MTKETESEKAFYCEMWSGIIMCVALFIMITGTLLQSNNTEYSYLSGVLWLTAIGFYVKALWHNGGKG